LDPVVEISDYLAESSYCLGRSSCCLVH